MTLRATVSSSCHTGQRSLSSHGRCRVSLTKGGWEGLYKKGGWEEVTEGAGLGGEKAALQKNSQESKIAHVQSE